MLTNLNRNSSPNRKNKSTKICICVYTPYRYSINSCFLFCFGLSPSTSDFFYVYRKKRLLISNDPILLFYFVLILSLAPGIVNYFWILIFFFVPIRLVLGKNLLDPHLSRWFTSPPNYETVYFTPLNFSKPVKLSRAVSDGSFATVTACLLQWQWFYLFLFYLFPLNLWKIIVNHWKIIKWKIQFCWTPRE
jgi:hypothetical protein